jgi:hypothetical protein
VKLTTISARRETAGAGLGRAMGAVALQAVSRSGGGCAEKPSPQAIPYPGLTMVTNRRDLAAVRTQAERAEQMMTGAGDSLTGLVEAIATQIARAHSYAMRLHAGDPAKALTAYERAVGGVLHTAKLAPSTFLQRHLTNAKARQERHPEAAAEEPAAPALKPLAELFAKRRTMAGLPTFVVSDWP